MDRPKTNHVIAPRAVAADAPACSLTSQKLEPRKPLATFAGSAKSLAYEAMNAQPLRSKIAQRTYVQNAGRRKTAVGARRSMAIMTLVKNIVKTA